MCALGHRLVKSPEPDDGYEAVGGKASEWLFIDPDHRDRFGHEGATVIPGSGRDWVHLHRKGRQGAGSNPHAAALAEVDDLNELPWQIIFIGDAQSRRSFNIECDPVALGTVLRSGVDLVLVGAQCYPSPEWVSELFAGGASAAGAAPNPAAARVLRAFGEHDPYAFCYDPLALLYHLQPEAFGVAVSAPVRLTDDGCLEGWDGARATGRAAEPASVSLDAYAAFLRQVSGL